MISTQLTQVRQRIQYAAEQAKRKPDSVRLLAVSKTFSAEQVREAVEAGQLEFGENYVQEGLEKIEALRDLRESLTWHFIGPLQSNKARAVAEHFDWMHSVDREKIAERLHAHRPIGLPPLQVCIQVNIDGQSTKSGVAPDAVFALAQAIHALPRLRLRGLMCIPDPAQPPDELQARYLEMAALRDELAAQQRCELDILSMGMSADLEVAIASGSTLVRVGTAIFGNRYSSSP
ncbi:MAG: YggS family pyridoxal phosphate-dependent enzyme [Pigmentiphaga sp.]